MQLCRTIYKENQEVHHNLAFQKIPKSRFMDLQEQLLVLVSLFHLLFQETHSPTHSVFKSQFLT